MTNPNQNEEQEMTTYLTDETADEIDAAYLAVRSAAEAAVRGRIATEGIQKAMLASSLMFDHNDTDMHRAAILEGAILAAYDAGRLAGMSLRA